MRFPSPLLRGTLIRRYRRFLADVRLDDGREVTAHCPNSGTMKTCSDPGSTAWISAADNPRRKLKWTLEIVEGGEGGDVPALVNTMWPNKVVREGIEGGAIPELAGYGEVRAEVRYGTERSRVDLLLSGGPRPDAYVEVKNVTLIDEPGVARFPDAVTARGAKHLRELIGVVEAGLRGVLVFHVGRGDASEVRPADAIDPTYGQTLRRAAAAGVEVLAYRVHVTPTGAEIERPLPVVLDP